MLIFVVSITITHTHTMEVVFNFGGFYGSHYDDAIDSALEGESEDGLDYKAIHLSVSKHITSQFNEFIDNEYGVEVDLKFKSLESPRYYNYSTDKIIVEISTEDIAKLDVLVTNNSEVANTLAEIVLETTTSSPGYIPYFDYDKVMAKIDDENAEVYYQSLLDALRVLDIDEYHDKTLDCLSESVFSA